MRTSAVLAATLWTLSAATASADIYQTTADDGALTLSNLPGTRRDVLIREVVTPGIPAQGAGESASAGYGAVPAAPSESIRRAAARSEGAPSDSAPKPGASSAGGASAEAAATVHFAPGAPGAPPSSESSGTAGLAEPPDRKASEPGWPHIAGESTPARPMPVAPSLLPSWAMLAPPGSGAERPDTAPVAVGSRIPAAAEVPPSSGAPEPAAGSVTEDIIAAVALRHELDPALLHAIVTVESAYNVRALSPRGAAGLMQLLPETARRYGISDLFDPVQNLTAGARYLRDLLALFKQDLALALAAYNAGENAVIRHGNVIPPYPETQSYVPRVLATYRAYARFFAHRRQPG